MRFGLMCMYPDATINPASTGQNLQMSQLPTDKKPEDATKQTTLSKSVFSTLDSNQNNKVNYQEANSIFANAQKSLENGTAQKTLDNAVTDATAKTNIKSSVLSKFNATESFKGLVSKFNANLAKTTATGSTDAELNTQATTLAQKLDAQVKTEAQNLINTANVQLDKMYNDAMMSAITDYNNGKDLEVNKDQKDNAESLKGTGDGKAGDIKTKANTGDVKFESKVFSKFDSTPDGSIKASQGEINIATVDQIVGNKLSALGADSKLASAIKNDLNTAYTELKNSYSIDIGSKDVKAKSADELERKSNEAIAKLDQKVQSKKAGADKKLEKAINKAYDNAYKTNLANASKLGDKPGTPEKPETPETPTTPTTPKTTTPDTPATPTTPEKSNYKKGQTYEFNGQSFKCVSEQLGKDGALFRGPDGRGYEIGSDGNIGIMKDGSGKEIDGQILEEVVGTPKSSEEKTDVHQEGQLTVTKENGKKGLSGIASQYQTADGKSANWQELAKANPQIKAPAYIIKPGDQLNIPEGWKKKQ